MQANTSAVKMESIKTSHIAWFFSLRTNVVELILILLCIWKPHPAEKLYIPAALLNRWTRSAVTCLDKELWKPEDPSPSSAVPKASDESAGLRVNHKCGGRKAADRSMEDGASMGQGLSTRQVYGILEQNLFYFFIDIKVVISPFVLKRTPHFLCGAAYLCEGCALRQMWKWPQRLWKPEPGHASVELIVGEAKGIWEGRNKQIYWSKASLSFDLWRIKGHKSTWCLFTPPPARLPAGSQTFKKSKIKF